MTNQSLINRDYSTLITYVMFPYQGKDLKGESRMIDLSRTWHRSNHDGCLRTRVSQLFGEEAFPPSMVILYRRLVGRWSSFSNPITMESKRTKDHTVVMGRQRLQI